MNPRKKIIFITGPTAIGKSRLAIVLSRRLNAEIISCDSMQIYKGMAILSAQPSPKALREVPHHLVAFVSPRREYDVFRYSRQANKKVRDIIKRGKTPLFVGGTGLYISIVVDGIFRGAKRNEMLRRRLYRQAEGAGAEFLYEKLKKVDPTAAEKIHPHDTKRIIRALEVFESTGKPISQWQRVRYGGLSNNYDIRIFCLNLKRSLLHKRIEQRVEEMFKDGVLDEVRKLLSMPLSRTASYAIGLRELEGYLAGRYDLETAKQLIKRSTRLYAKRQLTWFRKDKRIEWIEIKDKETAESIAKRILRKIRAS
ncbi:MAG: tRNA (adenosine(37)-N6)-dimethylallyltransferase MiaA [Candidatus Omnitrophica bacterium]|nr:tRNA (adenosine(37)-N6)-dimethylallyltransferase MiaA [Candidatus Omnitrophota bacterium]